MWGPGAYPRQDILLPANAHKSLLLALFVTRHFRQLIQCQEMVSARKYSLALQLDQHEAEHTDANRTDLVWQKNSASGEFCLFDIKLHFNDGNEFTSNVYSPQTRLLYKLALWDKKAKESQVKCGYTQRITYKYSIREHIWITLGKGDAHSRGLTKSGFEPKEGKCFWLFPQGNRFG